MGRLRLTWLTESCILKFWSTMNSISLLCLLPLLTSVLALPAADLLDQEQDAVQLKRETEKAAASDNGGGVEERATDCALFLCIRDGSTTNSTYPWLINNKNARFAYTRTDGEGYSSYSHQRIYNGQTLLYYLHFYDEGLFYNGFWVVNDLETGFVETEGRVFVYNSENDFCVEDAADYWYIWEGGDWQYNTNIYIETC